MNNKIINPLTGRHIKKNGKLHKQLIKEGIFKQYDINLLEKILVEATINDLFALYLSNDQIKNILNSQKILSILNTKYHIKSTNFINFFKQMNINYINTKNHITLYLYTLEYKLFKTSTTSNDRIMSLMWLYDFKTKLKLNDYVFGLALTLNDNYNNINDKNILCVCLYIASYMLNEYVNDIPYIKYIKITKTKFIQLHIKIINKLNGILIRPSTIFYTDIHDFAVLSYFSKELLRYTPSLIAETINYMITGEFIIYTLSEISKPCKFLHNTLIKLSDYNNYIGKNATKLLQQVKYKCVKKSSVINMINIKERVLLDIGEVKKLSMIGEGGIGKVYKVENINTLKYYALKKIKNNMEPAISEIATLNVLSNNKYIIDMYKFKLNMNTVEIYLNYGIFNLETGIIEKKLSKNLINTYIRQIIEAVDYCHYSDIIHRDLKPENIIYNGENLVLIDFGLSVPYASFKSELDPNLAASELYRAPEAYLGDLHYNYKIDIWALGLIIYFMITGKILYNDDNIMKNIFFNFGTPTKKTWANALYMPNWYKYKKYQYIGKKNQLKTLTKKYYNLISNCLILNPDKRSKTSNLYKYIPKK